MSQLQYLTVFSRDILIGVAQIMLQRSAIVGAAFVVGTWINSPMLTFLGLTGCLSSTLVARLCKFPKQEIADGLYGYNGMLVGLGIGYFYDTELVLAGVIVIIAGSSSLLMYWMLRRGFTPFTFPFVLLTWICMLILSLTQSITPTPWSVPEPSTIRLLESIPRGFGQVLFQESAVTGIIFIVVIWFRGWNQGLFSIAGASFGVAVGYLLGFGTEVINLGLFGYNGVLCGILFAGRSWKDAVIALVAISFSVFFLSLALVWGIPALTFPFVLASWLVQWGLPSDF